MKVELKYKFWCKNGFVFVRDTPEEIITIWRENINELDKILSERRAKGMKDTENFCNVAENFTNRLFPKATMHGCIGGHYTDYYLDTEVTEL
jgi:hypothetical protein